MEFLNVLMLPVLFILFKIQGRLSKVEGKLELLRGCKEKEEKE